MATHGRTARFALAALLGVTASAAHADPGHTGNRMRGGGARAEVPDTAQSPPPRRASGGEQRQAAPGPRDTSAGAAPPRAAASGLGSEAPRAEPRFNLESRRRDGDSGRAQREAASRPAGSQGWNRRSGPPRFDGGPASPEPDASVSPVAGGAAGVAPTSQTRREAGRPNSGGDSNGRHGRGSGDRYGGDDRGDWDRGREDRADRGRDRDGRYGHDNRRGSFGRNDRGSLDGDRRAGEGRNSPDHRSYSGHPDPRYRWHWRNDPRWRFDARWGFYDPLWRFHWQWGWYDPRWGWNLQWGYDPRWGWAWPYGVDWRLGVRAETAIDQDPLLRRWALASFDFNRDGWLDPRERRAAAQALEDGADLDGNRRLDARELAFARAEIERFGWDPRGADVRFDDGWP
jgi:hypothetical protein